MARKIRLRARETDELRTIADPDDPSRRVSVRVDTLWWMMAKGLIDRHEYFAGRYLQGVYLQIQIQPPKCLIMGVGLGFGGKNREDKQYPSERQFKYLKKMAVIQRRTSRRAFTILSKMFCEYFGDDASPDENYRKCLRDNQAEIRRALHELAWAIGTTTEHPNDKERYRLEGIRETLSRESPRLLPGGMAAESYGIDAALLRASPDVRHGNRAAA